MSVADFFRLPCSKKIINCSFGQFPIYFFSGNYSDGDNNSSSSSRGKKRTLEELFKPPLDIMFKGDWQSVRDAATAAKKWLIVNIQVRTLNAFLFEDFFSTFLCKTLMV